MARKISTLLLAALLMAQATMLSALPSAAPGGKYTGHQVVRITNPSDQLIASISTAGLDAWGRGENFIDLHVSPEVGLTKIEAAAGGPVQSSVIVPDLQKLIDEERAQRSTAHASAAGVPLDKSYFNSYHQYADIKTFLSGICSTAGSGKCTWIPSIGKSLQGTDISALKLGTPSSANKPQIYIQGSLHAREWAASSTVQYIVYQLLTATDASTKAVLDAFDIHVVPLSNPDGYAYTWASGGDRLWRKNRRDNGDGTFGVDLNRNYAYHWSGSGGASDNTDDETYRGPSAESEPETKVLSAYYKSLDRVTAAIDFHTFSQLILRPWGDTKVLPVHDKQYIDIGTQIHNIIKGVSGLNYVSEPSISLYPTTGTASDFFYSVKKTGTDGKAILPYGITIELRPDANQGSNGFILPPAQIIPTGDEIYPAFVAYANYSLQNRLNPSGGVFPPPGPPSSSTTTTATATTTSTATTTTTPPTPTSTTTQTTTTTTKPTSTSTATATPTPTSCPWWAWWC